MKKYNSLESNLGSHWSDSKIKKCILIFIHNLAYYLEVVKVRFL